MIAAQLIASHNAALECYRRAMLGEQSFDGRRENLNQANKLSRTYAEAKVSNGSLSSTSTCTPAARRSLATLSIRGVGIDRNWRSNSHAKQIAHAPGAPMPSSLEADREAVPCRRQLRAGQLSDARRRRRCSSRQQERPEARPLQPRSHP